MSAIFAADAAADTDAISAVHAAMLLPSFLFRFHISIYFIAFARL